MAISRFQMNRQLRAYGGIMGQDGRRNYGIGSFFQEKIMDPIKKVVKSPVGKAAAALGGSYLLGRTGGEGIASTNTGFKGILENILGGAKRVGKVVTSDPVKDIVLGPKGGVKDTDPDKRSGGILSSLLTSRVALPIASGLIAGAFTKDKEDPIYTGQDVGLNLQDIAKLANISDPKTASAIGLRFSPDVAARKFTPAEMIETYAQSAANGGRIGFSEGGEDLSNDPNYQGWKKIYEVNKDAASMNENHKKYENYYMSQQNMKAEGGIMDLGGMEKDYRNTGGFVDIGAKEKADDVPARLSVNEFVFTADAVRNAGGGDIDEGAKIMENMMKHLEQGGQISEESQGMAGARDMFATSERLSEVL